MAVKVVGLGSFEQELNDLLKMVEGNELVDAVRDGWSIVTDQMVSNIASHDLIDTGLMINKKSSLTNAGVTFTQGYPYIYAESGVFKSDSAMAVFGKSAKKDIPASLYAFWLEFGTQPHSLSSYDKASHPKRSNAKSVDVNDATGGVTAGIAPTYFISRAFDTKKEVAITKIESNIGELMDKYLR